MKKILARISAVAAIGLAFSLIPSPAAAATASPSVEIVKAANGPVAAWPMDKKTYHYTSSFGARCPVLAGAGTYHGAIDLAAPDGSPLYAIYPGKVVNIVTPSGSRTPTISIDHGIINGKSLIVSYGHMWDPTKYVKQGSVVKAGQRIGDVGSAGISNGPHVHFYMNWGDKPIDPVPFLRGVGIDIVANATAVTAKPAPTSCVVYTGAKAALKATDSWTSATKTVLPRNSKITIKPGLPVNDLVYVTSSSGGTGYVQSSILGPKEVGDNQPALQAKAGIKGRILTPIGSRHLFDYPSDNATIRGIISTVNKDTNMVTTGRLVGNYTEVTVSNLTGWIVAESVMEIYVPKVFGKIAAGTYKSIGAYSIYSSPTSEYKKYLVTYPYKLAKDVRVTATGRTHGNFVEVKYKNVTGWMFKTVLKKV